MHSAEPKGHSFSRSDLAAPARSMWLLSWIVETGVLTFLGLSAAAIALYPGGTFWNRHSVGYSFWQNFLCDLTQSPALNGAPNAQGSQLASFGMLALIGALVAFVAVVPSLLQHARHMTRKVRILAWLMCALMVFVPLLPSDRFGGFHAAAIFVAGVPVSLSLLALVSTLLREGGLATWLRAVSILLCVALTASLGLYAAEMLFAMPPLRVVPVLARVANLALVLWLIGLARLVRTRALSELAV